MAILALKQEALLGAVGLTGVAACGARLARVVGVHLDRHRVGQEGLVGQEAVQFGKRPLGGVPVGFALLLARRSAVCVFGPLADMGQVFQADETVRMPVHDAPAEDMVAILFQPSLPRGDHDQPPCRRAGAFLLQPFSQSRVVVSFGPHLFARKEGGTVVQPPHHRQVALPHVHPDDSLVRLGRGVCHLHFQGDEHIKALLGFIIPELGRADLGSTFDQRHMLVVARVRHDHAPAERQDADLLASLQAVVAVEVVGQRRTDVVGRLVQPLEALLGASRLALFRVLSGLRPQALVGRSDLPGDVAGHLGGKPTPHANFVVALALQPLLVALLAVRKRVLRDVVQGVAVGELCLPQRLELLRRGQKFQFGSQDLFHRTSVQHFTGNVKWAGV